MKIMCLATSQKVFKSLTKVVWQLLLEPFEEIAVVAVLTGRGIFFPQWQLGVLQPEPHPAQDDFFVCPMTPPNVRATNFFVD